MSEIGKFMDPESNLLNARAESFGTMVTGSSFWAANDLKFNSTKGYTTQAYNKKQYTLKGPLFCK